MANEQQVFGVSESGITVDFKAIDVASRHQRLVRSPATADTKIVADVPIETPEMISAKGTLFEGFRREDRVVDGEKRGYRYTDIRDGSTAFVVDGNEISLRYTSTPASILAASALAAKSGAEKIEVDGALRAESERQLDRVGLRASKQERPAATQQAAPQPQKQLAGRELEEYLDARAEAFWKQHDELNAVAEQHPDVIAAYDKAMSRSGMSHTPNGTIIRDPSERRMHALKSKNTAKEEIFGLRDMADEFLREQDKIRATGIPFESTLMAAAAANLGTQQKSADIKAEATTQSGSKISGSADVSAASVVAGFASSVKMEAPQNQDTQAKTLPEVEPQLAAKDAPKVKMSDGPGPSAASLIAGFADGLKMPKTAEKTEQQVQEQAVQEQALKAEKAEQQAEAPKTAEQAEQPVAQAESQAQAESEQEELAAERRSNNHLISGPQKIGNYERERGGAYRHTETGQVDFIDRGANRIGIASKEPEAVQASIELVKAKGWNAINVSKIQSPEKQSALAVEALANGMSVNGYQVTNEDLIAAKSRRDEIAQRQGLTPKFSSEITTIDAGVALEKLPQFAEFHKKQADGTYKMADTDQAFRVNGSKIELPATADAHTINAAMSLLSQNGVKEIAVEGPLASNAHTIGAAKYDIATTNYEATAIDREEINLIKNDIASDTAKFEEITRAESEPPDLSVKCAQQELLDRKGAGTSAAITNKV